MNSTRHVAHAVATTGSIKPAYRVDLRAGTHQLVADEPAAGGGGDHGPSPFELLLSALAACTATTLRMYADRHGCAPAFTRCRSPRIRPSFVRLTESGWFWVNSRMWSAASNSPAA